MKRIKFLLILALFVIFTPDVYAATFSVSASANQTLVLENTEVYININLTSNEVISECLFQTESDNNLSFVSSKGLNNWSVEYGDNGILASNNEFYDNNLENGLNILELKYKVKKMSKLTIKTVECVSVSENVYEYEDLNIDFTVKENTSNDGNNSPSPEVNPGVTPNEDGKLVGIILSEGKINFSADVYEYTVTVSDFDNLEVTLDTVGSFEFTSIDKEETGIEKRIVITLKDKDNATTNYIINVLELEVDNTSEEVKDNNKYVPIFIGIICLLIILNVFRIINKNKKKDC